MQVFGIYSHLSGLSQQMICISSFDLMQKVESETCFVGLCNAMVRAHQIIESVIDSNKLHSIDPGANDFEN